MDIRITCKACNGTGTTEHSTGLPRTCYSCLGVGWHNGGLVLTENEATLEQRLADLEDKVDDIMDKCTDIFDKLNE